MDFCLKVRDDSYRIIWTPWASLYHFESKTRDPRVTADEVNLIRSRWGLDWPVDVYVASQPPVRSLPRSIRAAIVRAIPVGMRPALKRARNRLRGQ